MRMMEETTDRMGNRVAVGSRLAVAFRISNSADLRVGRVIGFSERNEYYNAYDPDARRNVASMTRPIMLMEWEWSALGYTLPQNKQSYIYPDLKRFVKIAEGWGNEASN